MQTKRGNTHSFLPRTNVHKANSIKLYAHGMRPLRFLGACVWFHDVTSFSNASGMVCIRV